MDEPGLELKRGTRKEYDQLVECEFFTRADRIELIDGLLIVSEPQSAYHYGAIRLVERALREAFGEGWDVRMEAPIALDDASEPEPDVAVVRGTFRDHFAARPSDPVLVVEVALSSMTLDRRYKSSLYARAGRKEYWVLNLIDRVLEVRRDPEVSAAAPYGWDDRFVEIVVPGSSVNPLAAPGATIAVADLLPPL